MTEMDHWKSNMRCNRMTKLCVFLKNLHQVLILITRHIFIILKLNEHPRTRMNTWDVLVCTNLHLFSMRKYLFRTRTQVIDPQEL